MSGDLLDSAYRLRIGLKRTSHAWLRIWRLTIPFHRLYRTGSLKKAVDETRFCQLGFLPGSAARRHASPRRRAVLSSITVYFLTIFARRGSFQSAAKSGSSYTLARSG